MIAFDYDWDTIINDASECTSPHGPAELLALLEGRRNPWAQKDHEQQVVFHTAHQTDLEAIYRYKHSSHPLTDADRTNWVDRLAWLLIELNACARQKPELGRLAVILAVAWAFSFDRPIWERIPTSYLSDNLFASMSALVGSTECNFISSGQAEPIWERETVDGFLRADEAEDWAALEADWRTVSGAFRPNPDLQEAIGCLFVDRRGRQALAMAFDQYNSILQVINAASGMTSDQKACIAPLLKSRRARFGVTQYLAYDSPRNKVLSAAVNSGIASLFQDVQSDIAEWRKWMKALNRYPVRSRVLQSAFGQSLVGSTFEAKSAYIDAIFLDTFHSDGRSLVTECFVSFNQNAELSERKQFWQIVFRRWLDWSFGESDSNHSLTCMALSQVDFGIIGYFIENLSEEEHEAAIEKTYAEMMQVSNTWYSEVTQFRSAWNRVLSKWQIIQYAYQVRLGAKDWKLPVTICLPFDPDKDRFNAMTFSVIEPNAF